MTGTLRVVQIPACERYGTPSDFRQSAAIYPFFCSSFIDNLFQCDAQRLLAKMYGNLPQFLEWLYQDKVKCPDHRPRDRPMEILALGISRSGTDCKIRDLSWRFQFLDAYAYVRHISMVCPISVVSVPTRIRSHHQKNRCSSLNYLFGAYKYI